MCNNATLFVNFKSTEKGQVKVANGQFTQMSGKGTVFVNLRSGETLKLDKVLFVPNLDQNLVSERQLDKRGYEINLQDGKKVIRLRGEILSVAPWSKSDKMYQLETQEEIEENKKINCLAVKKETWHRRFGHMTNTPELVTSTKVDNCEVCHLGKMKRMPFPPSDSRAAQVLDFIHTDVGQMQTKSLGGNKYFIIFLDDKSRYGEVYTMKHKSEALEKFKIYKQKVENLQQRKIKAI